MIFTRHTAIDGNGQPVDVLVTSVNDVQIIVCVDPDTCFDTGCPTLTGTLAPLQYDDRDAVGYGDPDADGYED